MRHYGRIDHYDAKRSPVDLVSVADRESDAFLSSRIGARFPNDVVITEEADGDRGAGLKKAAFFEAEHSWIVDPLDGTTSFVHGYPFFAVSIGIARRGRPSAGVVYAPYFDELYVGGEGIPATMNARPIQVSRAASLERALLASGFAYDRQGRLDRLLAPLRRALRVVHDIRRAGAASLDMCHVASGRVEGYFEEGLAPWDVAAGEAIVAAAGGRVTSYDGSPHDLYGRSTLATNGLVHQKIVELLVENE